MSKPESSKAAQRFRKSVSPHNGAIGRNTLFYHWEALLFSLLLVLTTLFYTYKLENPSLGAIEYDEGLKMMVARVVAQGYPLYQSVFTDNSPLYIGMLALGIRIFGTATIVGRSIIVTFGLLGVVGVFLLGREIASPRIGLLSAVFLALSYRWFQFSRLVMEEVPSATFQVFTLLAFIKCLKAEREDQEVRWALLTGVCLTVAALFKTFSALNFFLVVPLLIYFKRRAKIMLAFFLGWAIPLLVFLPLDIEAAFTQIVLHPLKRPRTTSFGNNFDILRAVVGLLRPYTRENPLLVASGPEGNVSALAILGFFIAVLSKRQDQILVASWAVFQGVYLLTWGSLYIHHVVLVLPFIPILAALSTSKLKNAFFFVSNFIQHRLNRRSIRIDPSQPTQRYQRKYVMNFVVLSVFLVAEMILFAGYLVYPEQHIDRNLRLTEPGQGWGSENPVSEVVWQEVITVIQTYSAPTDWVISDLPNLIYLADRLIVPELCDSSYMRIASGFLTSEYAIEMIEKYNVPVIVFWTMKLTLLDEFVEYVHANFTLVWGEAGSSNQVFWREIP